MVLIAVTGLLIGFLFPRFKSSNRRISERCGIVLRRVVGRDDSPISVRGLVPGFEVVNLGSVIGIHCTDQQPYGAKRAWLIKELAADISVPKKLLAGQKAWPPVIVTLFSSFTKASHLSVGFRVWRVIGIDDKHFAAFIQRYGVSRVLDCIGYIHNQIDRFSVARHEWFSREFQVGSDSEPGSLSFLLYRSLGLHFAPHVVSDDGVYNDAQERTDIKSYLPPWRFVVAALAGLVGVSWGWWNLKGERPELVGAICFIVGIRLWGYACNGLLLWSTKF